ncbi:MAG: chloride channel protein, partial [Candidatus Thorarchaeota archaeon]
HMGFQDYLPYLHWFILLGIATGFAAVLYIKSVGSVESFVHKLNIHPIIPPIAGAFLTGMIGIISPKSGPQNLEFAPIGLDNPLFGIEDVENIPSIFGNGYETITQLFANSPNLENWSFLGSGVVIVLLLLISLKLLATAFSVGSGNSGGVFAPALFVGAATGYCYATILNSAVKTISFTSQDYALFTLVGLAAVFAGSSRAILTMIFMASELTSSYYAFIPLMITCSISYFISRLTLQDSIYTLKLRQKGLKVSMAGPTDLLETMKVKDIMTTDVICVPENMTMKEFYPLAQTLEYFGYPIINFQGKYQGIVTVVHLRQAQLDGQIDKTVLELGEKDPYVLYPDETVEQAMSLLYRSQIGRIAVLDSPETNNLVGIVSHTDIIKCLELQKVKDHEDRKRADLNMIKHELRVLEETIGEHPQLKEKVKVIRRKPKEALWERNLLEYLRECSEKVPLEPLKEEKHEKSTKPSKKKKSSTAKTTTKSIRTKKPPKTKVEDKKPNENE